MSDADSRLWVSPLKGVPPRPTDPASLPQTDPGHWYDLEYAGWGVRKAVRAVSPGDGPRGKRVVLLCAGRHPYITAFAEEAGRLAAQEGMILTLRYADWDGETQMMQVAETVAERPDMVILMPEDTPGDEDPFRRINEAGIPVIGANMRPQAESFRHIVAWTGPDDWTQSRVLARHFAGLCNHQGGYAIVCHVPGTSTYTARAWGVITELAKVAPRMRLLDMAPTGFDPERTKATATDWIRRFGSDLVGIVSADDYLAQTGINQAVAQEGRQDIIRVANGSTTTGLNMIRSGTLHAVTFQSAKADGGLALRAALDWFSGLQVEPIRFLPVRLITPENVEEFVDLADPVERIDLDPLVRAIVEAGGADIDSFFDRTYRTLTEAKLISLEYVRGLSIELLAELIMVLKQNNLDGRDFLGNYESLFKHLFMQATVEKSLEWLREVAHTISGRLVARQHRPRTVRGRIVDYVDRNFRNPISLKTMAYDFGVSAAYLGQAFKRETGKSFTSYVNERRIHEAMRLLRTSDMRANEVAREVGFSDPNYFYSVFRKISGRYVSDFLG